MSIISNTSVIIVTYNHRKYIEKCLNSLINLKELEIIIVDNNSTDETIDIINRFPQIKLIKNPANFGYSKAVNIGVVYSKRDYIIVSNPDTIFQESAIIELLRPLDKNKDIITIPKVLLYDKSDINTCGNIVQFTGLTFTKGLGKDKNEMNQHEFMNGLSGVCFAIRKELYLEIGGLSEDLFLYMEDAELSWKINSKELNILYVPKSIIYHDYSLKVSAEKIYHLEIGRYILLKKYYTWNEYLIFAPSLLLTEIFTWGYAFLKGFDGINYKLKAINSGRKVKTKKVDCNRKELIMKLDWKIPEGQLSYNMLDQVFRRIGNLIYLTNYNIVVNFWSLRDPKLKISQEVHYLDKIKELNRLNSSEKLNKPEEDLIPNQNIDQSSDKIE